MKSAAADPIPMSSSLALPMVAITISTSCRRSQFLGRCAARETIAATDRRIHDAELSDLSAAAQPVSARAAAFLREPSPVSPVAPVADIPASVRASELIQMWRELEADVLLPSPPFAAGVEISERRKVGDLVRLLSSKEIVGGNAPADGGLASPEAGGKVGRVRRRRGAEDFLSELVAERRREVAGIKERRPVSRFPFRGRIQVIFGEITVLYLKDLIRSKGICL